MIIEKKPPKIIGIIPARYASTRFPGKPLVAIKEKTLIQRTYENALRCRLFDDLIVATDDQKIFDHVQTFGKAVMTSTDCQTGTDRVAEAVKKRKEYNDIEIVVNIQGDEPCIRPETIASVIYALTANPLAEMATAITPLRSEDADSYSVVKCVKDLQGRALYFSRSLIPGSKSGIANPHVNYFRHIGLYAYRRDFLFEYTKLPATPLQLAEDLEQLKALEHGYTIMTAEVQELGIGVDVPADVDRVIREINS